MSVAPIPLIDLNLQHSEIREEVEKGWKETIDRNSFILGPNVRAFEEEAAAYVGTKHAVGLASGTDALLLALRAAGVGPGDEVILPAFTFVSTAEVIVHLGATPVYADIDPVTYCLTGVSPTTRTRAIIPVHLFGHAANMDELKTFGLPLIEDGAQAFGTEYHGEKALSLGTINATSFFPSKNLGCWGDGGMVFTDDDDLCTKVKTLRNHGWLSEKYFPKMVAYNSRLDELQAVVLRAKLKRLAGWNDIRRAAADRYAEMLEGVVETPTEETGTKHIYHMYTIRSPKRDAIAAALQSEKIGNAIYYPVTIPGTEAFRTEGSWPNSEAASREVLAIPLYPGITTEQQSLVSETIRMAVS